jgi:hypothetical protein
MLLHDVLHAFTWQYMCPVRRRTRRAPRRAADEPSGSGRTGGRWMNGWQFGWMAGLQESPLEGKLLAGRLRLTNPIDSYSRTGPGSENRLLATVQLAHRLKLDHKSLLLTC